MDRGDKDLAVEAGPSIGGALGTTNEKRQATGWHTMRIKKIGRAHV